jgi:DNA polymerase III epsilon subunit-like protein
MSVPFSFIAIDFETTGSVAGYPVEPWQIGVVAFSPEQEPVVWESLLRIGERPFHPQAPGRHSKLRESLKAAPTLEECLPHLRDLCGVKPLLAHNVATEQKCLQDQVPMEAWGPWLDSLKLSRAAWPTFPSHRLEDILLNLNLTTELGQKFPDREPHRAGKPAPWSFCNIPM